MLNEYTAPSTQREDLCCKSHSKGPNNVKRPMMATIRFYAVGRVQKQLPSWVDNGSTEPDCRIADLGAFLENHLIDLLAHDYDVVRGYCRGCLVWTTSTGLRDSCLVLRLFFFSTSKQNFGPFNFFPKEHFVAIMKSGSFFGAYIML